MNNLINFIYDLKNIVRKKQHNEQSTQSFLLNNIENEINNIIIGDLEEFYYINKENMYLKKFDPVRMGINLNAFLNSAPNSYGYMSFGDRAKGAISFYSQEYLTELLNMQNLNFGNSNQEDLFGLTNCRNLGYANFYNWNFYFRNYNANMGFRNCTNLEWVDLSNWNINRLLTVNGLFWNCQRLKNVYLNNWNLEGKNAYSFWNNAFRDVSNNCIVWVKDDIAYNSIKSVYPSLDVRPCVPLGGVDPESKDMMEGTVRKYSIPFYGNSPDIEAHKLGLSVTELEYPLSYYGTEADNYGRPIINYETNTIDFCVKAAEGAQGSTALLSFTLSDTLGNSWSFTCDFRIIPYVERAYTVSDIPDASYGFILNSNGYYESQNKGIDSSYAICRVDFHGTNKIIFDCINYAESNYDFGILSNVDSTLSLSNSEDSSAVIFKSFKGQQSPDIVSVVYDGGDPQDHFIYVKYRKDGSVNKNYDSLQFKIRFE